MHLLDSSSAVLPTVSNTWFITLVKSLYLKVFQSKKDTNPTDAESEDDDRSSLTDSGASRNGTSIPKENGMGRAPAMKAGGKRKKATRKRQ